MKKTLAMSSLLLALALGSCSSDEPDNNGGTTGGDELGYVAVNIVQSNSTASRAASAGFEYGSDDENKAETGLFYIFKADGTISGTQQEIKLNGYGEGTNPEVERIYNAVLVIDGSKDDPTDNSKQIVCVLNAPSNLKTTTISTLDELKAKIGNYRSSAAGTFIMTNSVFTSDGKFATEIEAGKVAKSAAAALNNPVNIYVERVVAKVRAKAKEGGITNTDGANPAINGALTKLDIKVTGIEIANIASKSHLFKSVGDAATATEGVWKATNVFDANNKRSYWETVPAIGTNDNEMTLENRSYNEIIALHSGTDDNPFNINTVNLLDYVQPNTLDKADKKNTCVLVTAQLTQNGNPYNDLAYIRGGYTTTDDAKKVVATYLATKGWYKKIADNKYTQLEPNDLEWKNEYDFTGGEAAWLEDYEVVAQLKSGEGAITKIYDISGTEITDGVNTINSHLKSEEAKNYRARVFTNGMCYYYVYIDQSTVVGAAAGTYPGVVRNHIYDLTLESIKGIGTPVFDPDDKIIPQTPGDETTFYLSAKVNVLAWKVATQNIQFQGK